LPNVWKYIEKIIGHGVAAYNDVVIYPLRRMWYQ